MAETGPGASGGGAAGTSEEFSHDAMAFEALERDFQEVLQSVMSDKSLDKFRQEYEKLHTALKKAYDNEKRLVKKVRELNNEIVTNAAKVATALKLSEDDDATIDSLKKQIEKAWAMVESYHEREIRANETIQRLKGEIGNLTRILEKQTGLAGKDNTVDELLKVREVLTKRNEEAAATIQSMQAEVDAQMAAVDRKRQKNREKKAALLEVRDQVRAKDVEIERENKKKERLDKEIKDLKAQLDQRGKASAQLAQALKDSEAKNTALESELARVHTEMDTYLRNFDTLAQSTQKLTEERNDLKRKIEDAQQMLDEKDKELKSRQEAIGGQAAEIAKLERLWEGEKKKTGKLSEKLGEEKTAVAMLKSQVAAMQAELDAESRHAKDLAKTAGRLELAKASEERKRLETVERVKEEEAKVEESEQSIKHLENKIARYREEAVKTRNVIYHLEKDREKFGIQLAETQTKLASAIEDGKLKDSMLQDAEKREDDMRNRLKQQQQMYENVRADRNNYSKSLIEAQDEIAEMKRKFKIMTHQIDQLKDEITAKDRALVAEHFDHEGAKKLKEQKEREVESLRKLLKQQDDVVAKQTSEMSELNSTIRRMDANALQQRQEYDQVVTERDILGTQLIRRNDELALLYEKVKIMESTLKKGEAQYADRIQDIRILKLKIGDLKRDLGIQKGRSGQVTELEREIHRLQKDLLQEKTKVKALSEELENPMNVHRWRKLEGSDPATYEMIQKIQTLQKRLIAKTEEAVEKEMLLQEKDRMYAEVKGVLARQPGPEVAEQLSMYQQNLKEKTRQMKALASELNMYQAQINEYKYEIERLARELQEVKRKYYEVKRKSALGGGSFDGTDVPALPAASGGLKLPPAAARIALSQQVAAQEAKPRFTGGGFNIQQ